MKESRTWIFGYGSLMWNPGFSYHCWRPALLRGYHRSYGMYSTRNRGTTGRPGMILSLAPGRDCTGMAYHVEPGQEEATLAYLDQREGLGKAHRRVRIPLHPVNGEANTDVRADFNAEVRADFNANAGGPAPMAGNGILHAYTYLPILSYPNYIQGVPVTRQAELVASGEGYGGSSFDYLRNTLETLSRMGVAEPELERLFGEVQRIQDRFPPKPAPSSTPDR